jgi:3D (Asp-Asp-Asp) domain-containing protein
VGGIAETIWSVEPTLGEALAAHGIGLGANDRVEGATLADAVRDGMSVRVVRVTERIVEADEAVPFGTTRKNNNFLAYGTENVIVQGVDGSRHVKWSVRYEDGAEVSRTVLEERVLTPAVEQVVERGTILAYTASRGITFDYTASYDMLATAYYCDNNIGITYTGEMVRKGIVAVDPNVIPLGSLVYVEVPGGEDYGYAIAADIGGAIIGMRIDVYLESYEAAIWWGLTDVRVYVLK